MPAILALRPSRLQIAHLARTSIRDARMVEWPRVWLGKNQIACRPNGATSLVGQCADAALWCCSRQKDALASSDALGALLPAARTHSPCSLPQEITSLCWVAHHSHNMSEHLQSHTAPSCHDSYLLIVLSSGHMQVRDLQHA